MPPIQITATPLRLVAAVLGIVGPILAGNYWFTTVVAERVVAAALQEHSKEPHRAAAEAISESERQIASALTEVQIKQSGFSSDISWIKSRLVVVDGKLDRLLGHREVVGR